MQFAHRATNLAIRHAPLHGAVKNGINQSDPDFSQNSKLTTQNYFLIRCRNQPDFRRLVRRFLDMHELSSCFVLLDHTRIKIRKRFDILPRKDSIVPWRYAAKCETAFLVRYGGLVKILPAS